ncbi:MAG: site-specific tyrosine recombinase XerD [Actinomycetes bacterium]
MESEDLALAGENGSVERDSLSVQIDEYSSWLKVERGLSTNTLSAYRRDLKRYSSWLRARGITDLDAVGESEVFAYIDGLKRERNEVGGAKYAPSSIARALVAVRSLHRFCVEEGLTSTDPSDDVGAPRVPQGIPKALSEEEVLDLLGAVEGDSATALRDRAILETLYATGMRISELVGLDRGDIDLEDRLMRVVGKGNKERVVPVGASARSVVLEYLQNGRPELEKPTTRRVSGDPLFLNARGGRLTRQSCWKIVTKAGNKVGLEGRLSPHVLRHCCATHMLDHGADIRVVQELLGHASLSTTQIYTLVTPERLRSAYDLAHPRAGRSAHLRDG